jgi:DNA-binding HxlR family transcriptional regulator
LSRNEALTKACSYVLPATFLESGNHFDASRAELFEALGHPTRVKILRTLEDKPIGFAELKREVGIESSGHLQFHLGKLTGLVTTNTEGSYALTDDGREAIRVLNAIPAGSEHAPTASKAPHERDNWLKPLLAVLLITIVVLAGVAIYQENSQISTLESQVSSLNSNLSTKPTFASVTVEDASVPASAWQNSSGPITHVQCGQTQLSGSGWLNLTNTGNGPATAGGVAVYVSTGLNPWTKYYAEQDFNSQNCIINPSSSLTVYFTFYGPTPTNGEYYDLFVVGGSGLIEILGTIS